MKRCLHACNSQPACKMFTIRSLDSLFNSKHHRRAAQHSTFKSSSSTRPFLESQARNGGIQERRRGRRRRRRSRKQWLHTARRVHLGTDFVCVVFASPSTLLFQSPPKGEEETIIFFSKYERIRENRKKIENTGMQLHSSPEEQERLPNACLDYSIRELQWLSQVTRSGKD